MLVAITLAINFGFVSNWWQNMTGIIASFRVLSHILFPPLPSYRILKWIASSHHLQPVVSNISKHNTNAIITGDFNIDLLQINERSEFQKYFDLFTTHGLFPSITLPTRSSGTLIDQIYCKLKDPKQLVFSCVIDTMISDHYPCFAIVDILKTRKHKPKIVQVYKHDPAAFYDELSARFQKIR